MRAHPQLMVYHQEPHQQKGLLSSVIDLHHTPLPDTSTIHLHRTSPPYTSPTHLHHTPQTSPGWGSPKHNLLGSVDFYYFQLFWASRAPRLNLARFVLCNFYRRMFQTDSWGPDLFVFACSIWCSHNCVCVLLWCMYRVHSFVYCLCVLVMFYLFFVVVANMASFSSSHDKYEGMNRMITCVL